MGNGAGLLARPVCAGDPVAAFLRAAILEREAARGHNGFRRDVSKMFRSDSLGSPVEPRHIFPHAEQMRGFGRGKDAQCRALNYLNSYLPAIVQLLETMTRARTVLPKGCPRISGSHCDRNRDLDFDHLRSLLGCRAAACLPRVGETFCGSPYVCLRALRVFCVIRRS